MLGLMTWLLLPEVFMFKGCGCAMQDVYPPMMDWKHQQELHDVLAHHVVPLLRLRDAQALSQTCSSLRSLVHTGLPATTWSSLAHGTFPRAHPILAAHSSQIQSEVAQLAEFHASVRSGKPLKPAQTCMLQEGCNGVLGSPACLSHSAELFICEQEGEPRLYSLALACVSSDAGSLREEHNKPTASLLLIWPTMESSNTAQFRECTFSWSPDDSWVAIRYSLQDFEDARALDIESSDCYHDVFYAFDVATKEVAFIMHTKASESFENVLLSSDSKFLLLAWSVDQFDGTQIDIYDQPRRRLIARVRDEND